MHRSHNITVAIDEQHDISNRANGRERFFARSLRCASFASGSIKKFEKSVAKRRNEGIPPPPLAVM
jgi:hypothetical protein